MKKLLLMISVLATQVNLNGQTVPNGTFESWTSVPYNDPTGWTTGNKRDLERMGIASVTKVTGFSGFALRLETHAVGPDTSESYVINTANPCNDPPSWTGGVPFSQIPTAITGYYRYSLPGNDTAIMIVIFRKNGAHVGDNLIKIKGTGSQLTFTSFSFPVTCSVVPDSVIIAAASSNKISNAGVQNGSFLELDNLAFAGTTQLIPNGNFESWNPLTYDVASGWELFGEGASKTTLSYAGSSAIRLETVPESCGNLNPSGITTGHMSPMSGPVGGRPYSNMVDTLTGYYKYIPSGPDSAMINISMTNSGSPVGGASKFLAAAATYTYFQIPLNAFSTPDSMRVDIQSSKWPVPPSAAGSVLYVDNISLKSAPLGIAHYTEMKSFHYPDPVKDILTVQFDRNFSNQMELCIYDAAGRKMNVPDFSRNSGSLQIDLSTLSTGIYFYEIRTSERVYRSRFIKD